jgi:phage terminase small subunit
MSNINNPAPQHLSPNARTWWAEMTSTYDFNAFELLTLQAAAEAWDAMQQARALILREGAIIPGRSGVTRAHPAHAILRDSTILWIKLTKALGIPDSGPK